MSVAFVCNTPYQILNCIRIIDSNIEETKGNSDLFIVDRFNGAFSCFEKIVKMNIFNKVYFIKPKKIKKNLFYRIKHHFVKIKVFEYFDVNEDDFYVTPYQKIFLADLGEFGISLLHLSNADLYLYEDGMMSYYKNFIFDNYKSKLSIIDWLFKVGPFALKPKAIYLNNPEFCSPLCQFVLKTIPSFNENVISQLKKIFQYDEKNVMLTKYKSIFLDPNPNEEIDLNNPYVQLIFEVYLKNQIVVKKHPRRMKGYEKLEKLNNKNLWELDLLENLGEDVILISTFSTSLFTPKLLANKEPYIIFLYRLISHETQDNNFSEKDYFVEKLRSIYSIKSKIFVPESIFDLEYAFNKML